MTRFHKENRQCMNCFNEEAVTIWDVIDPCEDDDLRDRLLRKQLQIFSCTYCGQAYYLLEPLLYVDAKHQFIAYYSPQLAEIFPNKAKRDFSILPDAYSENLPKVSGDNAGFRFRLCQTVNQQMEKIHIFEAGLDDRLIEVVKLAIKARLQTDENKEVTNIYFLSADKEQMLFVTEYYGEPDADSEAGPDDTPNKLNAKSSDVEANTEADLNAESDLNTEAETLLKFEDLSLSMELYNNAAQLLAKNLGPEGSWSLIDEQFAAEFIA